LKRYYILPLFFILTSSLLAQKPFKQKVWEKQLKNISTKSIDAIGELSTGHLVLLSNGKKEASRVIVMRRNGEIVKTVSFNKYKNSQFNALTITKNNKILLVGTIAVSKDKAKGLNGWAILMNVDGKILWENIYGGEKDDEFKSVLPMDNNHFLLVGNIKSRKKSKGNAWAVRINDKGEEDWSYNSNDYGNDNVVVNVGVRAGNIFILGGYKILSNKENGFLIGINEFGNKLWRLELPEKTNILAGIQTFDNKAVFTGYQISNSKKKDVLALKVDADIGKILWKKTYKNEVGDDYGQAVLEMLNGELILLGHSHTRRLGSSITDVLYLRINTTEGITKDKIGFWGVKKENAIKSVFLSKNNDIILGGTLNELPYIGRFKTVLSKKPIITWNNIGSKGYKRVFREEETFLEVSATISSPVLLNKEDLKIYMNHEITNDNKYYENLTISEPSISISGDEPFLYIITNRILVQETDSVIEIGLYNNLYSVRSIPFYFKLVTPFRLDIFFIDPVNENGLTKTVYKNEMLLKMVVVSSEELSKGDFHIIINGKKRENAKYNETVIKRFQKKNKSKILAERYNYFNKVFLQKGRNEIRLAIDMNGETHYSTPIIRNYEGAEQITVDSLYNKNVKHLYVLMIDAQSNDLKYTANNVQNVANTFKKLEHKKVFKSVEIEQIIGEAATKTNIDSALKRYKKADEVGEITQNDLLFVLISSNGFNYKDDVTGGNNWMFFEKILTQASNFDNIGQKRNSVAYENIISILGTTHCKKIILIDTFF
jgi:hypothetical protein